MARLYRLVSTAGAVTSLLLAEAVVRGHKSGLFTSADYNNLCQCETLEDIKLHLVSTVVVSMHPACLLGS